jgi:hypothetical protein
LIDLPDDVLIACIDRFDRVADRIRLFRWLAGWLQSTRRDHVLGRVLAEIQTRTTDNAIEDELALVASLIADQLLPTAFSMALRIRNRRGRIRACDTILGYASPAARDRLMRRAFDAATGVADLRTRAELLCDIAWHLVADDTQAAFAASLAAVDAIESESEKADTLLAVARALPEVWIDHALDAARRLPTPIVRVRVLTELAAYVNALHSSSVLREAVAAAERISEPLLRDRVVRALRRLLPEAPGRVINVAQTESAAGVPAASLTPVVAAIEDVEPSFADRAEIVPPHPELRNRRGSRRRTGTPVVCELYDTTRGGVACGRRAAPRLLIRSWRSLSCGCDSFMSFTVRAATMNGYHYGASMRRSPLSAIDDLTASRALMLLGPPRSAGRARGSVASAAWSQIHGNSRCWATSASLPDRCGRRVRSGGRQRGR